MGYAGLRTKGGGAYFNSGSDDGGDTTTTTQQQHGNDAAADLIESANNGREREIRFCVCVRKQGDANYYFWFSYQASEKAKLDLFAVTASFAKFGQDDDFPPRYCRALFWLRGALLPPPFPLLLPG